MEKCKYCKEGKCSLLALKGVKMDCKSSYLVKGKCIATDADKPMAHNEIEFCE
jgi:hypothetical protein